MNYLQVVGMEILTVIRTELEKRDNWNETVRVGWETLVEYVCVGMMYGIVLSKQKQKKNGK